MRGSGVTSPAACRTRRIVEVDGTCSPACSRCQAMVTGPASHPAAVSSSRIATMNSRTLSSVACGLLPGLRERGSTASRPLALYRAIRRCRCWREYPYSAAAAETESSLLITFRTATRALDMAPDCHPCRDSRVAYQLSPMSRTQAPLAPPSSACENSLISQIGSRRWTQSANPLQG